MSELACQILERNGFTSKDLALVVPHQANLRIIRAMQERLGVDDSKVMVNIDRYRKHHRRDDSAGIDGRGGAEALAQGRSGAADRRGRGLHDRRCADALGYTRTSRARENRLASLA